MGIIETLSNGFDLVRRKPYLLVIPILLDLLLLFGPRISIDPVAQASKSVLVESLEATSEVLAMEDVDLALTAYDDLISALGRFNVLSLLPVSSVVIPSVSAAAPIDLEADNVIYLTSPSQALLTAAAALLIGLFIGCIYWGLIAEDVRGHQSGLLGVLQAAPRYWLQMLKFALLLVVLVICVTGAMFLASTLGTIVLMTGLTPIAQIIFLLAELFALFAVFTAVIYLFFVPQAVTVIRANTREAIQASLIVTRLTLWPAVSIIMLTALIRAGMSLLWAQLAGSILGTIVAIVGNAFIGTGLIVATFIFFRDRIAIMQERLAERSMTQNG